MVVRTPSSVEQEEIGCRNEQDFFFPPQKVRGRQKRPGVPGAGRRARSGAAVGCPSPWTHALGAASLRLAERVILQSWDDVCAVQVVTGGESIRLSVASVRWGGIGGGQRGDSFRVAAFLLHRLLLFG